MPEQNVTITFYPSGARVRTHRGANLLEICTEAGVGVDSVCGGNGKCGKCIARLLRGSISPPTSAEEKHLSDDDLRRGFFLLCQREALSDLAVDVERASFREHVYRPDKGDFAMNFDDIDPHVSKRHHDLNLPSTSDQTADLERILQDLPGCSDVEPDALEGIPSTLRATGFRVTSVLFHGQMIAIERDDTTSEIYGIAFDIGTTTVAGYLADLRTGRVLSSASSINGQISYGADVLTRISHTMKRDDGFREMQRRVLRTVDAVASDLLESSGIPRERVYAMSFAGNTVMSHFLLGISAAAIAAAPFVPVFTGSTVTRAKGLGLKSVPGYTRCILLPNIAGYVGADTVGLILATGLQDLTGNRLAIDVGTNGEIVLASDGDLLTCSTAAGPAFEGGCISQGMRAVPGAIYRVDMAEDVHVAAVGEQKPAGICGSGLIDAVSEMVRLGILNSGGRIIDPEVRPNLPPLVKKRITPSAEVGYEFLLSDNRHPVRLIQKDISELQLAKGAIRAGIEVLLEEKGLAPLEIDEVLLAGAFGSRLRPESMMGIGLLPDIPLERIKPVGNAAGKGAVLALLSKRQLRQAVSLAKRCRHVELSIHKGFSGKFARALTFG